MQLVRWVVLESYGSRRCPLRVFLRDTFLRNAPHVYRLSSPQLHNAAACAF